MQKSIIHELMESLALLVPLSNKAIAYPTKHSVEHSILSYLTLSNPSIIRS